MLTFPNLPLTIEQRQRAIRAAESVFHLHQCTPADCWPHVLATGDRGALRAWYAAEQAAIRSIARSWYAAEDAAVRAACKSWRGVPPGARMDWEPAQ